MSRNDRLKKANDLLRVIAQHGRHFFYHEGRTAQFCIRMDRVWFIDDYRGRAIYTHHPGRWKDFTHGGTLRVLIRRLSAYIFRGDLLPPTILGPWPEWVCGGDLWGYGDDMELVRQAAQDLGITAQERDHGEK